MRGNFLSNIISMNLPDSANHFDSHRYDMQREKKKWYISLNFFLKSINSFVLDKAWGKYLKIVYLSIAYCSHAE